MGESAGKDHEGLRIVDAGSMDAESILGTVEKPKRGTQLEIWLEAEGPEAEALFWEVMEKGRDRGMPFAHVLDAFLKQFPLAPAFNHQSAKRVVDAHFDADR